MAPRALWSGSISFGLVSVPVRIYPAIAEHKLHFQLVHEKDEGPIGYQKVCKLEGRPVPDDEIVKAFEYRKGEYVILTDEDFEQAQVEGYRTIDIADFVPYEEIDPIFFAKAYFLGPGDGGDHVYSLLVRAMEDSGLAAVAKFVMREQQHLGALRVYQGVIVLEQLHFADEQRPVDEIRPAKQRIAKEELEMAAKLIESYQGPWRPEKYKDTYRDELLATIRAKRRGAKARPTVEAEAEEPRDLMEALRESINRGRKGSSRPTAPPGRGARSISSARSRRRSTPASPSR